MSRGVESHIVDMLAACDAIAEYRQGFTRESFARDRRTVDAVARNLEIRPYFVVDVEILWDAAAARVPKLRIDLEELRQRIASEP